MSTVQKLFLYRVGIVLKRLGSDCIVIKLLGSRIIKKQNYFQWSDHIGIGLQWSSYVLARNQVSWNDVEIRARIMFEYYASSFETTVRFKGNSRAHASAQCLWNKEEE